MISPVLLACLSLVLSVLSSPLNLGANNTMILSSISDGTVFLPPADSTGIKNGMLCGNFATASKNDVVFMLREFRRQYPDGSDDLCGAPANTCTRQTCRNTSGLYDNATETNIRCSTMANWLADICDGCCTTSVMQSKGLSGQQFSTAGWNVVVAFADCNDDPDADRPSDFSVWGPNGQCLNYGGHATLGIRRNMDPKHSRLRDFPVAFVAETNEQEAKDGDPFYSTDGESDFSTGVNRGSDNSAMVKKSVSQPAVRGAALTIPPTSEDAMAAAIAAMESGADMFPEMASFLARKSIDRNEAAAKKAAELAKIAVAKQAAEESTRAAAKKAAQASLVAKPSINVWGGGSDGIEASPTVVDDDADWVVSDERARDAGNGRMIHEATLIQRGHISRETVRTMPAALSVDENAYDGESGGVPLYAGNNGNSRIAGNTGNGGHGGTGANNDGPAHDCYEQYPQYSLPARSGIPEPKQRRQQRLKLQELPVTPPPRNKGAPRIAPQKELPERPKVQKVVHPETKPEQKVYHNQVRPPVQHVQLKKVPVRQVQVHHVQSGPKSEIVHHKHHKVQTHVEPQTFPQIRPRVQTPKKFAPSAEGFHDQMDLDHTPVDNKARDHKAMEHKAIDGKAADHMVIDDKANDVTDHAHQAVESKVSEQAADEKKAVPATTPVIDFADARAAHIARWVLGERHRHLDMTDDGGSDGIAVGGSGGKTGVDHGVADGATEVTADRLQWPTLLRDPTVNNDKLPATEPTGAQHQLRMTILTNFAERCRQEHGNGGDEHRDDNGYAVPLCSLCLPADAFTMRPQHGHLFLDSVLLPLAEAISYAEMVVQVNTALIERVFKEAGLGESHDTEPMAGPWNSIRAMPIYEDYQRALVLATHRRRLFDELPMTVDTCGLLMKGYRK
ncbi:hypothetical protein CMQ_1032 [Grosmannia clavigera kw1407]|uniref:Uncharacterized protein n=1 Tax=Grosmannia clavigera (strain kw1407 / UAMH 11150) TaxID=655863 RepID=F0XEK9_GROCL|nr:uncharacterized protein CMQ_1032 [Grosmannia clavigera kw1407]EFX04104.1 hypothetical protein CMQ_1032 [Grosmannia clavigera kw1407]